MFAHKVIEDLKDQRDLLTKIPNPTVGHSNYIKAIDRNIYLIEISQKIHIDEPKDVVAIKKSSFGKERIFMENSKFIKMPYNVLYVDYFIDDPLAPLETRASKIAAIISKITDDEINVQLLAEMAQKKQWILCPLSYFIKIGNDYGIGKGNVQISDPLLSIPDNLIKKMIGEDTEDLSVINCLLLLLNCKNILTEKVIAPIALNKKRKLNGKQEIFDYHVLNIVVPSSNKHSYQDKSIPLSHNRIHLCRGHFKEYTSEHPLFGKYTGLWWWQPSVRGQNKDGIVLKDYNCEVNNDWGFKIIIQDKKGEQNE